MHEVLAAMKKFVEGNDAIVTINGERRSLNRVIYVALVAGLLAGLVAGAPFDH